MAKSKLINWKRVGVTTGPCNVLNDRYRVQRAQPPAVTGRAWLVYDLGDAGFAGPSLSNQTLSGHSFDGLGTAYFPTMVAAKAAVEDMVNRQAAR